MRNGAGLKIQTQRPSEDRRLDEGTEERRKKQRLQGKWDARMEDFREKKDERLEVKGRQG